MSEFNVLSIDWDYFMDCSNYQREALFPDGGNENIGVAMGTFVWATRYAHHPEIGDIGVIDDLDTLINAIREGWLKYDGTVYVADSHKEIYYHLRRQLRDKADVHLNIFNIDHHHDYYNHNIETEVNCGNWMNALADKSKFNLPSVKGVDYYWCKRDDSCDIEVDKDWFHCINFEDVFNRDWDFIFICKSPVWAPPHLDHVFFGLTMEFDDAGFPVEYEENMSALRAGKGFYEAVKQMKDSYDAMTKEFERSRANEKKSDGDTAEG